MKMKMLMSALALTVLVSGYTGAAEKTAQQQKMTLCNQQAGQKSLKGDERKTFMSSCLKKDSSTGKKLTPQQAKMKTCNAQASDKTLKGAARKTFMSNCLKKS